MHDNDNNSNNNNNNNKNITIEEIKMDVQLFQSQTDETGPEFSDNDESHTHGIHSIHGIHGIHGKLLKKENDKRKSVNFNLPGMFCARILR